MQSYKLGQFGAGTDVILTLLNLPDNGKPFLIIDA